MATVTKLYRVERTKVTFYDVTEITPEEFQKDVDVGTTLYVAIKTESGSNVSLNYSRLITDTILGKKSSWFAFGESLTDEYISGYSEVMPGYLPGTEHARHPIQIWDAMNTLNTFELDYGDYQNDRHGILPYMYNLPDLRISLYEEASQYPNLQSCLPIVNGFVCRPVYRESGNYLYALDGSRLCWQIGEHKTPEVQLVDFKELGEVSIHPIYLTIPKPEHDGFVLSFMSRTRQWSMDASWILTSKYDLSQYTPLVVLGGVLIFPDKIYNYNQYSFRFDVNDIPWDITLAYKKYLIDETSTPVHMFYNSIPVEDYLKSQMQPDVFSKDTFVILVKTPSIFVNRIPVDMWRNGITINLYTTEGLLLHNRTHTLRVYHSDTYSDRKELILQNMEEVYVADNDIRKSQLAFVHPDCQHIEFTNLHDSNCTMIHMMR